MDKYPTPHLPDLFAGIDNLSLDKREFDPSRDGIESICRFFCIGGLRHYEKEKGIIVSHSNFFVFVSTSHGQYALKFYPPDAAKTITIEYALNRILTAHHFPTPMMFAGTGGKPFLASHNRLAACYAFINGRPAWQLIKQRNALHKINAAMMSLKNILSATRGRIPFPKQASLAATIRAMARDSRLTAPYDQKAMIDASLQDIGRTYQHHQRLFTRQWLHNNANLTNFLIYKKTIYTLDLTHIREDYALSDLASLIISCLFFDITAATIKTIVKDYFAKHKIRQEHFLVLNTLVKIGLVKEYLKNIRCEKSAKLSAHPPDLVRTYTTYLSKRKKAITAALKNAPYPG